MSKWGKIILNILRTYSIEEKVVSVIVFGLVAFLSIQIVMDTFSGGTVLAGDAYSEGIVSDRPAILNPLFVDFSEANRDISSMLFSGLLKYDPSKKAFVDDLASLALSDDKKTYKFILKQNLVWHDGSSITADDVYFTFHDLIQSPDFKNPVLKLNFEGVQINKIDQQTIEFQLKNPNSFFISNFNIGILPKHILGKVSVADLPVSSFNIKPVGSGPYKMDAPMQVYEDGRQLVTLTAFDKYYGPKTKINKVRFTVFPDEDSLLKEKNGLNIISKIPVNLVAGIQSDKRFNLTSYSLPQYTAVFFNLDRPIIGKSGVRMALQKAVYKANLLQSLNDKLSIETPLLDLNQTDWTYKSSADDAKLNLYDAGYKLDKTKGELFRRDSKGNLLKLSLMARVYDTESPMAKEVATVTDFLKKAWGDIGLQLDVQLVQDDEFNKRLQSRDYDMVLTGQSLGYNLDTYSYWHSSQVGQNGLNLSNFKSFAADQLIENIRTSFDNTVKDQKSKDLAKVLVDNIPALFLYRPQYYLASDNKVKNLILNNMAYPSDRYFGITDWCVSNCN